MENLMRRALDRLAVQSYRNYEVILVNDGSVDRSGDICEEYAEAYHNFTVIHKKNGGISSARNAGIEVATGEWVTFCDPDDIPSVDWLTNYDVDSAYNADLITQGLESNRIGFGPKRDSKTVSFDYEGDAPGLCDLLMQHNNIGYTWCKLYRLQIIRENCLRFDSNICLREDEIFLLDYLLYVRRAKAHKRIGYFYFMPEWGNKYRLKYDDECYINDQADKAIALLMSRGNFQNLKNYYIDSRNYNLMLQFGKTHEHRYLEQIRQLLLKYPDSTRLSPFLKFIISIDRSMTLSWIALYGHMKIKMMLGK
ncbi:MAG: glycosyltransferase [Muribaculum sp.]|nr:glycosyltransferase [Muribaculum sp.]